MRKTETSAFIADTVIYILYIYCYVYRVRKRRKSRILSRDRIFSILDKRRSSTVLKNEQRRGDYRTTKKERKNRRSTSRVN